MPGSVEIKYALSEQDYLVFNLFTASRSPQFKRKLLVGRFVVGSFYLIAGVFFLLGENIIIGAIFLFFGLAWLFFYHLRIKQMYKRHFKSYIQQNLKDCLDVEGIFYIHFEESRVRMLEQEFTFAMNQIIHVDRIPEYTYIRIKGGKSVIIPEKKVRAGDLNKVFEIINEVVGINPVSHADWKW